VPADGSLALLQAECDRLRQRLDQLEKECQHERQARLAVQAERDSYHRSLTALLRERAAQMDSNTDDDLDRLAQEAERLGDFSEELRQLLQIR
jgi:hypothetical protein